MKSERRKKNRRLKQNKWNAHTNDTSRRNSERTKPASQAGNALSNKLIDLHLLVKKIRKNLNDMPGISVSFLLFSEAFKYFFSQSNCA